MAMLRFHIALAASIMLTCAASLDSPPYGYAECACATSATMFPNISASELASWDADGVLDEATYGIGCDAHDAAIAACSVTAPAHCDGLVPVPPECHEKAWHPAWCEKQWCWLADPKSCTLAHQHSLAFPSSSRYYSYATCGDLDLYFRTDPSIRLAGRVLKVGVQSNTGGWQGSKHPTGVPHTRDELWTGPLWVFVTRALQQAGVTINITAPDALVQHRSGSPVSFVHCTYATAIGQLDMCIGMHTVTPGRYEATRWHVMQYNALYLVVRERPKSVSLLESFQFAFVPFSALSWLLILALAIPLVAIVVTLQERLLGAVPEEWDADAESTRKERVKVIRRALHEESRKWLRLRLRSTISNFGQSFNAGSDSTGVHYPSRSRHVYENLLAAYTALYEIGMGHSRAMPARLSQMGLGIFILLVSSAYTANMTTALVNRQTAGQFSSWLEVMNLGVAVCGTRMGSTPARATYPQANWVIDPYDGHVGILRQSDVLNYMDAGLCEVAVMDYQDVIWDQANGQHCDKKRVGDPIAHEPVGMPLTTVGSTSNLLGQALDASVVNGDWDKIKNEYRPESTCELREEKEGLVKKLDIFDLFGCFVLLGAFVLVGLMWSIGLALKILLSHRRPSARARAAKRQQQQQQQQQQQGQEDRADVLRSIEEDNPDLTSFPSPCQSMTVAEHTDV